MKEKMMFQNIDEIYDILGTETSLIPIKRGEKTPDINSWKNLTHEDTKKDQFRKKLAKSHNIGVLLGKRSNALCTIDIDSDEVLEAFFEDNPSLYDTLITKGERGANVWFRPSKTIPNLKKYDWGEIRGEGAYTVICGLHPSSKMYSIVNLATPIRMELDEIKLPMTGVNFSHPYFTESESISATETETISYNYITRDISSTEKKIKALNQSNTNYEEWKKTASISEVKNYETYITREDEMDFNIRNNELIKQTTTLYNRVGTYMTETLVKAFYNINKPFFRAEIHEHMNEFSAHLRTLENDFLSSLKEEELKNFLELSLEHKDTFRICRDLASYEHNEQIPPFFHLSCNELGKRLNLHAQAAQRLLKDLKTLGFISLTQKGQQYKSGRRSKASIWKWNLS